MEQVKINPITIESAKRLAINVVKKEFICNVKAIKYLGGGSFGYAYKVDIDTAPYTVLMKACRCDNMYHEIYCYICSGRRTKVNHLRCLLQLKKELKKANLY